MASVESVLVFFSIIWLAANCVTSNPIREVPFTANYGMSNPISLDDDILHESEPTVIGCALWRETDADGKIVHRYRDIIAPRGKINLPKPGKVNVFRRDPEYFKIPMGGDVFDLDEFPQFEFPRFMFRK